MVGEESELPLNRVIIKPKNPKSNVPPPTPKRDWNPLHAVERGVDKIQQKYHKREKKIKYEATGRLAKRAEEIHEEEKSGKISKELAKKWESRAKKRYEKEKIPIEQRIEKGIDKGKEALWKHATTMPKKKDSAAGKVGKVIKNILSYGNVPPGLNTLSTPLEEYTERHNPVGRPKKGDSDYGILGGIRVHGFGGGGIGSFETYDDPYTEAGMFKGYQSPFGGGEQVKRGRGRPRSSGSEGSNPLFAPISGLGGYQSPFAGMRDNQPRGRGRPRNEDRGGGGFLPSGISGFDTYQSPFAGAGSKIAKRKRGRPRKIESNDSGGSLFSLGL